MNKKIIDRITKEANYILATRNTLREVAKKFHVSKSTVHKDISERLSSISPQLATKVRNILDEHLKERHIRGGESTKIKYQKA